MENEYNGCGYKNGSLPDCAPLAVALVPMQASSKPQYDASQALSRGTLFPGLDLPFKNVVNNKDVAGTPLGEVMDIGFVIDELRLYLDTHPKDEEAFRMLKNMLALAEEARRRYTERYGPLDFGDMAEADSYTWLTCPWPWNYSGKEG